MLPYRSMLSRLQTQHEAIAVIVKNLPEEKLKENPAPGKWSIKDNIAHLAKYQPIFIDRLNKISAGENPVFESYVADNDAEFSLWQSWDIETLLDRLASDRALINTMISEFTCKQIESKGTHKKFGELTLIEWTEFFLLHEAHHIFTIFKLAHSA